MMILILGMEKMHKVKKYSKKYDTVYFKFEKNELHLVSKVYGRTKQFVNITKYKFWFIPLNFKVYRYKIKIDIYFRKRDRERKRLRNLSDKKEKVNILKSGIAKIESKYTKAIRKEKLKKLM